MQMMKKSMLTGGVLLTLGLSVCAAELPSDQVTPAPFAAKTEKKEIRDFTPEIKGNRIISGSRSLEITENGSWRMLIGGEEIFVINNSFKLQNGGFVSSGSKAFFQLEPVKFANNAFELRGTCKLTPDGKRSAKIVQAARLLPDGLLEVELKVETAPEDSALIGDESLFLSIPQKVAQGHVFEYQTGKKKERFVIPVDSGKRLFSTWQKIDAMNFFDDRPEYLFSVIPVSRAFINAFTGLNRFNVQFRPLREAGRTIKFKLDLRRGTVVESGKTYAGQDWQKLEALTVYDRDASGNLLMNPSFEQGSDNACWITYPGFAGTPEKWEKGAPVIDGGVAKFGKHSLRLSSWSKDRRGDWRGIYEAGDVSIFPVPVEPGDYVFSCYVKGNRKGQDISVWAAKTCMPEDVKRGGDRWIALAKTRTEVGGEWRRIVLPVKVPFDMPLVFSMNVTSPTGDGEVWIDGMQLERGSVATAYVNRPVESALLTSAEDHFVETGRPLQARLKVSAEAPGKGKLSVMDFFGNVIYRKEFTFQDGSEIGLPDLKTDRGVFVVRTDYELENGRKTYDFHRFSVMDFMNNTHRLKNLFCVDYNYLSSQADFPAILQRCRQLGMGGKSWFHQEFKETADMYRKFGMDISHTAMCTRGKTNRSHFWIYPNAAMNRAHDRVEPLIKDFRDENPDGKLTEDYLKRFDAAVQARVKAFPWVKRWSMGGEDDAAAPAFAGLSASDEEFSKYVTLQIAFYNAVKKANPEAQVVGGQIPCNASPQSGIHSLERFLKAVDGRVKFDLLAIHIYRESPENPDLDSDLDSILKIMDQYGYEGKQLFLPEGGYYNLYSVPQWGLYKSQWNGINNWMYGPLSYDMGWTEKISAAHDARTWLAALKYGDRVSFVTLALVSSRTFGMDISLTPFAMQKAVNTLAHLLGDSRFRQDIRFAPYVRCYLFEDAQKRPVAAVWSHDPRMDSGAIPAMIASADFGKEQPEILDFMECARRPAIGADGRLRFAVGPFPMFFRGRPGTLAEMAKAFTGAVPVSGSDQLPVEMSMRPTAPDRFHIELSNLLSREFRGEMTVNGKVEQVAVAPNEKKNIGQALPEVLRADRMTKEKVTVTIDRKLSDTLEFEGIVCRKITGAPDWNRIPEVPFVNRVKPVPEADFSGSYQLAWDENNLYIRVNVRDDRFFHEEYAAGEKRWNNDSLQIFFDTLLNARLKKTRGFDGDDYDYAVFPDAAGTSARVWRNLQPDIQLTLGTTAPRNKAFEPEIPAKFTRTAGGYVYEAVFPAKYLLPIRLKKGSAFGFSLFVNDRDDAGGNVKSCLTLTPDGTGSYNNPHLWPVMLLWNDK